MKVGIVTITNGENYGNRLQNYAMQEALKKLGYDVETIRKKHWSQEKSFKRKLVIKKILKINYDKIARRMVSFKEFNDKYIKFGEKFIISDNTDEELNSRYDVFVCGSDQIWNPYIRTNSNSYFLSFVKDKKKVAVSASFGVSEITEEENKQRIKKLLGTFDAISVREKEGKNIVESLTNIKTEVLIDPTLMLDRDEWVKIEKRPQKLKKENYILCYLLGNYDDVRIKNIKKQALDMKKEVVFLENENRNLGETTKREFAINPSEFIWLVRNSEKVITDSFHAVVFSILFNKEFSVLKRDTTIGNMSSRFHNLSSLFNIEKIFIENDNLSASAIVDYDFVNKILREERKKFNDFVIRNL